jgi:hypothetical protein
MLGKVKAMWERFTGVCVLRRDRDAFWVMWSACERTLDHVRDELGLARKQRDQAMVERDAGRAECEAQIQAKLHAIRLAENLNAELKTARRTAALHRSLIAILRDVNRDLDERLTAIESKPEAEPTP